MNAFARIAAWLSLAALVAGCGSPTQTSGGSTDTGNSLDVLAGLAIGTDSLPATDQTVRLRRADYLTPIPIGLKGSALRPAAAIPRSKIDTVTGIDGRFRFTDVDTGRYLLEVGDLDRAAVAPVSIADLADHPTDRVDFDTARLAPTTRVVGGIQFRAAAERAWIQVYGLERLSVASPSTGRFLVRLPRGAFRLRFTDPGCPSGCEKTAEVTVAGEDSLDIGTVDLRDPAEPFAAWRHSARVTVNTKAGGAGISRAVHGFPMLVRLDSANFDFTECRPDGGDLRFAKAGGRAALPYEIERWDTAAKRAEVWVRLDTVKGEDDSQHFLAYWGNDTALNRGDGRAVFDTGAGHAGVWHLAEDARNAHLGHRDATGNANHGTGSGFTDSSMVDGAIGAAQRFTGADEEIRVADHASLDVGTGDFTLSLWARAETLSGTQQMVSKRVSPGSDYEIQMLADGNVESQVGQDPDVLVVRGRNTLRPGDWHHLALQRRGDRVTVFLDGAENASRTGTPRDLGNDADLLFGRDYSDALREPWRGSLDEVRLMRGAASPEWIRLSYHTQRPGASALRLTRLP